MSCGRETGRLRGSEAYAATPSPLAMELFFYVTQYGHDSCGSHLQAFSPACQGRPGYLLLYTKGGTLCIEDGGTRSCAGPGQISLLDLALPQRYGTAGPAEYDWLIFNGPLAERFVTRITAAHGGRRTFQPAAPEAVERELRQLLLQFQAPGGPDEAEISQVVQRLLIRLLEENARPSGAQDGDPLVRDAIRYIDEHYAQDLSVEDVAASVGLSYSHLSRRFKARTGCSIHAYITRCRIRKAQQLLLGTDMPLKRIAVSIGYRSEASFIVAFQSKRGCTPTEYRGRAAGPARLLRPEERAAL